MVERVGWAAHLEQCRKIAKAENYPSTPCSPRYNQKSSEAARAVTHHTFAAVQACWRKIQTTARHLCHTKQSVRRLLYRVYESLTYPKNANPPNHVFGRSVCTGACMMFLVRPSRTWVYESGRANFCQRLSPPFPVRRPMPRKITSPPSQPSRDKTTPNFKPASLHPKAVLKPPQSRRFEPADDSAPREASGLRLVHHRFSPGGHF